ncbi:MAG: hypothetical protein ACO3DD_05425, partial [Burkholderiaceae bacterium]
QVADDIRDVIYDALGMGKPAGQDETLDRPSAAHTLGLDGAVIHFDRLMARAIQSIPACRGAARLRAMVLQESQRLVPAEGPHKVARAALDAQTERALAEAFPNAMPTGIGTNKGGRINGGAGGLV